MRVLVAGLTAFAALTATTCFAQSANDVAIDKLNAMVADAACTRKADPGEIVVCGRGRSEYRLPLPRDVGPTGVRAINRRGEMASVSVQRNAFADCGPFQGQRDCGKAEARAYGYSNGRDPLTGAVRLVTLLVDPDAEIPEPVRQ